MLLSIISNTEKFLQNGLDDDTFGEEEGGQDHDSFSSDQGKLCAVVRVGKLYPPHSNDF